MSKAILWRTSKARSTGTCIPYLCFVTLFWAQDPISIKLGAAKRAWYVTTGRSL